MAMHSNKSGTNNKAVHCNVAKIPIIVGVTGHRDLRLADVPKLEDKVRELLHKLKKDYPHTPLVVVSSLAEGADRLVARVGLEEKAGLIAVLPMPQADYETDFTVAGSLDEFRYLLSQSSPVVTVPPATLDMVEKAGADLRDCQYALASAWVVRHCHLLVALWDGQDPKLAAGTAQTVSFMLNGVPAPYDHHVNEFLTGELGAVHWIVTPRQSDPMPEGAFTTRHLIGEADWGGVIERKNDSLSIALNKNKEMLRAWYGRISRMEDFNRECGRFKKELKIDPWGELKELQKVPGGLSKEETSIAETFLTADGLAVAFKKTTMVTIVILIAMVLAGFTCLQVFLEMIPQRYMLALYPLALTLATGIYFIIKRENIHDSYLEFRALAEGQRVQFFWNIAGIDEEAVEVHLRNYEGVTGWVTDAMRAWTALAAQPKSDTTNPQTGSEEERIRFALNAWVKDKNTGQLPFFKKTKFNEHRAHKLYARWSFLVYALSAVTALMWVLAYPYIESEGHLRHFLVLAIALGVSLSAALEAISQKKAHAEHSKNYERMERIYTSALKAGERYLEKMDINGARRILRTLGEAALEENAYWLALHRSRPIDAPKG